MRPNARWRRRGNRHHRASIWWHPSAWFLRHARACRGHPRLTSRQWPVLEKL